MLSGEEAVAFANGTTTNIQNGAFKHSFVYNAFSNVTNRSGRYWSEPDDGTDTYNNQGRNAAWSYDADGRVLSTNEPAPNANPYSPLTFTFNAAGQRVTSAQTTSRQSPVNPEIIWTNNANTTNTFDGHGQLAKMTQTDSLWASTFTRYYLRSSVTGNTIVEYDQNGTKIMASVYAGGEVIAQQMYSDMVLWEHVNPVMGDGISSNSQGWLMDRTTVDPTGVNTGDTDPFLPPAGEGQPIDPSQSSIDSMVAQMIPGWGGPKCYINGGLTGCYWAATAGEGFERARRTYASIYSERDRRYVGFAFYNQNQAAQGISVFGLPAGWAPAGMNFSGSGFAFSNFYANSQFAAAAANLYLANSNPSLAGHVDDLATSRFTAVVDIDEMILRYVDASQSGSSLVLPPPPPPKSKELQRAIDLARQMLKTKECNDAISSLVQDGRSAAWTLDNNSGTVDEQPDDDGGGYVAYTNKDLSISFYKGFYSGGAEGVVLDDSGKNEVSKSSLVDDPDLRRAWTVLHELSHATGRYIGHDLPGSKSTAEVNRRIFDACLKQKVKVRGAVGGRVQ